MDLTMKDPTRFEEEIIQFFKKVYLKYQKTEAWFSSRFGKSLTMQQAAQLEKHFTVEEIKKAVFFHGAA